MNAEQQALVARFDGFLSKIFERQAELMDEAEQGMKALAAQYPDDFMPLSNAISGIDHRMRQLRERIQEAWDAKIDDQFSNVGDGAFLDLGLDKKADAEMKLEHDWQTCKARVMSDIYREMWPQVSAALEQPVPCNQCGGALALESRLNIVSTNCGHCGAANQVVPLPVISNYFGMGAQVFADAAALPLRQEIDRFRVKVDRQRRATNWKPESLESMEQWNEMERSYWMRFAESKAKLRGEQPDLELVESRMTSFRKYSLKTDQRWRAKYG